MRNLLVTFLISSFAFAGPIHVGNGGGESEFHLLLAKRQMEKIIDLCRSQRVCATSLAETRPESLKKFLDLKLMIFDFEGPATEAFKYVSETNTLDINQKLLLDDAGQGLSLANAVGFLAQFAHRYLQVGDSELAQKLEKLVAADLPVVRMEFPQEQVLEGLNLKDGSIAFAAREKEVVLDSTLIDMTSYIVEAGYPSVTELKSGQLNYAYNVDNAHLWEHTWNTQIEFKAGGKTWKGTAFLKVVWDLVGKKFEIKQTDFWMINLREK